MVSETQFAHFDSLSLDSGLILTELDVAYDTDKYFVLCANVLGGCKGTTGPGSINSETGCPYAMSFPLITIADMVRLQKMLIDHLGIQKLLAVSGGSMGAMQALQ